jgi:hypothetical protein
MIPEITEFSSLVDLISTFSTEQKCIDHLEAILWGGFVVSPFDPTSKVYKCAGNKYKCKNTGKYFNVKTKTIFDDTKIPLQKWFMAIYLIANHKKGISSHQLSRDIKVTQKTAWYLLHRVRFAFNHENFQAVLENTVEADETFVGGKNKNRHKHKKTKGGQGRSSKDKTPVAGLLERGGNVMAFKVADTSMEVLQPIVLQNVKPKSNLMTDEWGGYNGLGTTYNHGIVHHAAKQYVDGNKHTNSLEGFWSLFKRGVIGIYHSISPAHIQNYLYEFVYRYNTRTVSDPKRFNAYLLQVEGKKLKYKTLTTHE